MTVWDFFNAHAEGIGALIVILFSHAKRPINEKPPAGNGRLSGAVLRVTA